MKIKDISTKTGVSARMIRYYEEQGLLKPNRTTSGYRSFSSCDLNIIRNIQSLQEAGLTLDSIRILMPCIINEHVTFSPCPKIISTLKEHKAKIQADLQKNSHALFLLEKYLSETEKSPDESQIREPFRINNH
ncbi:MerR family transcriptional regulator [Pectobacteriaceae bacterium CE90]|nr:MerR family transcriptional regulator [Serratia sp. ATCC 39006]WJY15335.1 MerR family transcriptional regulator [Pectobacteriaceae bacterium CE90]